MTEPTDANAELMKAAVKRSRDQYKLDTSRAAFQAGAIFGSAFRTPQPTQAQAGAVPLTDEKAQELIELESWGPAATSLNAQLLRTIRRTEAAHGIKGGQHGTE